MRPKYQTKEFKELVQKWYAKLESTGFEDIEQEDGNLKQWESHAFGSRYDPSFFNSKEKYYQLAGQFLHDHKFRTKRDEFIWKHYAEGLTIVAIAAKLKSRNFKVANRSSTHETIQRLEKEMLEIYANSPED